MSAAASASAAGATGAAGAAADEPNATDLFRSALRSFCEDLRATFPELTPALDRALTVVTPLHFWRSWAAHLEVLLRRDSARLFSERRGLLVAPILLPIALWNEVSETTHAAIWKHLRNLVLFAIRTPEFSSVTFSETESRIMIAILIDERNLFPSSATAAGAASGDAATGESESDSSSFADMFGSFTKELFGDMSELFDKLKGFLSPSADGSGGAANIPMPELPEHLKNGRIMRLAKSLMEQFKPEEFGVDAATIADAQDSSKMEETLRKLAEQYQKDPTPLIAGAKAMAERIRRQVLGGSLKPEEIIEEVKELMAILKDHPFFKEAIEKFQDMVGGEEGLASWFGGSAAAPSARLRATQERMRRKLAARKAKMNGE